MCLEQTWSLLYITVLIERHRKHTYLPSIDLSAFFRHKEGKSGCVAPPPRKKRKDRGETRRRSTTRQSTTRHAQKTHTERTTETERAGRRQKRRRRRCRRRARRASLLFLRVEIKTGNRNVGLFLPGDQICRRRRIKTTRVVYVAVVLSIKRTTRSPRTMRTTTDLPRTFWRKCRRSLNLRREIPAYRANWTSTST